MKQRYDDIDEYIADLKMEIAANEQCATHHYNLGLALLSKRDFVGAEEALLNAVRNSPHLAEAYVQLGGICLERGDLEGCLRYNEEAAQCRSCLEQRVRAAGYRIVTDIGNVIREK